METALVQPMAVAPAAPREVPPGVWQLIQSVAPIVHQSRLFGVSSPAQAQLIMLRGYELGLPLTAAFELIQIVQNRPSLSSRGALAIILQSGQLAGMKIDEQAGACTVWMRRTNGIEYRTTFTLEDARRPGLVKPGSAWQSYPANMLKWRAVGFCADVVFPDLLAGMPCTSGVRSSVHGQDTVIEGEIDGIDV